LRKGVSWQQKDGFFAYYTKIFIKSQILQLMEPLLIAAFFGYKRSRGVVKSQLFSQLFRSSFRSFFPDYDGAVPPPWGGVRKRKIFFSEKI